MHGVGVFDYASIPGVIESQVYLCPFGPCTSDMMSTGECLTFIQAVAVKLDNAKGVNSEHRIIWRDNALRIDGHDRKEETNVTLGMYTNVTATGKGTAMAHPDRVQHETLADCHVLEAKGQLVPELPGGAPMGKMRAKGWHEGGTWKACTNNEWTLSMPQMTFEVGVIGPFEEGYLREQVSDRTFNLNVINVTSPTSLQGIVNGDKNGLFTLTNDNPEPIGTVDENIGALVPKGPHGYVQEVTAPNVKPEDVLFPERHLREMDAACGEQQALRAFRMDKGESPSSHVKAWKTFKSRTRPQ